MLCLIFSKSYTLTDYLLSKLWTQGFYSLTNKSNIIADSIVLESAFGTFFYTIDNNVEFTVRT